MTPRRKRSSSAYGLPGRRATWGGRRPWFICSGYSRTRYCGRCVALLYGAGDFFACRRCYGLAYASRVLNAVALAEIPNQQLDEIKNLTPAQRDRLAKYCNMGVKAIAALMEFSYPKLTRIDLVGDAPSAPTVENRYKFVLNITDAPGRPVIDNTGKNDGGAGQAHHDG
jgi:hypothetical protein